MSHGDNREDDHPQPYGDRIHGTDFPNTLTMQEVKDIVTGVHTLVGKPKVIFSGACRGRKQIVSIE